MFNSLRLLRHILTILSLMPTPDSASVDRAELGRQFMFSRARTVWHNEKVSVAFLNAEDGAVPQVAVPLEYNAATQSPLSSLFSHSICLRPTGVTVELDPATQSPLSSLLTDNRCFHPPDPDPESSATTDVHDDTSYYKEFDSHFLYFYGSPVSESIHIPTAISTSRAHFHDTSSTAVDNIASQSIIPPAYYTSGLHSIVDFSSVYLLVFLGNLLAFFTVFGFLTSANTLVTAIVSVGLLNAVVMIFNAVIMIFNAVVMIVNAVPTWQLILCIAWIIGWWSHTDTANVRHRIRCGFADLADSETAWTLRRVLIRTSLLYKQLVHYLAVDDILMFQADIVRSALPSLRLPKRGAFRAHDPSSSKEAARKLFSIEGAPVTERSVVLHSVLHSSSCSSLVLAPSQNSVLLFCLIVLASSSLQSSSALSLSSSDSTLPLALPVDDPTLLSSSSSTSDLSLSPSNLPQDSMTSFDSEDSELLPSTPELKPSGEDDEPEAVSFVEGDTIESEPGQTLALAVDDPTLLSSSSSTSDLSLSSSNLPQDSMTSFDSKDSELLPSTPELKPSGEDDEPEVVSFDEDDTIVSEPGQTLALAVDDPILLSSSSSTSDLSLSSSNLPQDSMISFDSEDSELLPSTPELKPSGGDDEPEVVSFVEDDTIESESGQTTEATPRGMFDILQKGYESRVKKGAQPDGPDPARDPSIPFLGRTTEEAVLTYLKLKSGYYAGIALLLVNAKDATDNSEPSPAPEDGPPPTMDEVVEEEPTAAVNSSDAARRKKKRKPKCQRKKDRQVCPEGGEAAGPSSRRSA